MKILAVQNNFSAASGGGAILGLNLFNELERRKHEVTVLTYGNFKQKAREKLGKIDVFRTRSFQDKGLGKIFRQLSMFILPWLMTFLAIKLNKEKKFDLLLVESPAGSVTPCLKKFGLLNYKGWFIVKKMLKIPSVVIVCTLDSRAIDQDLVMTDVRKAERIVVVDKWMQGDPKMKNINPTLISVGIPCQRFKPCRKENIILSVSRLDPEKQITILIRALAIAKQKLNGWKVIIIGKGSQENQLQQLAKSYGLNGMITFKGAIPNTEIQKYYQKAKIFFNGERANGISTTTLESMASGCLTLRFAAKDHYPIVSSKNGFVFSDEKDLAEKLIYCGKKYLMFKNLVRKAIIDVQKFDIKKIADEYEKIFKTLG